MIKVRSPWALAEVLVLWGVVFAGSWLLARSETSLQMVEFLREHFYIFTKEPLLKVHVYIFTETFVLKLGVVLVISALLLFRGKNPAKELGLTKPWPWRMMGWTIGYAVFAIGVGIRNGFDVLAPDLPTSLFFKEAAWIGNTVSVLSMLVVAPITEEIFFRGRLQPVLGEAFGAVAGVLITACLFAGAHYPQVLDSPESFFIYLFGGLWLSMAKEKTGSTWYVIFLHMLYNGAILGMGFMRYATSGF